jgi:arsenate reductase
MMLLIEYPKCSTCSKAKQYLVNNNCKFETRDIVLDTPNKNEIDSYIKNSGKDVSKFFNTSGMVYRELGLKDKLPNMTYDEKIKLLASNGMLIKRPILVTDNTVLVGFREKEWSENI